MLELTPKYSVIIPVYNAEKTLRRCVDSLLTQQYADAEIILVNDGSTDSGGEICKEYAASNRQVQYIDKANGGVSSARNAGIRRASGRYILFVDSDDSVVPGYFEQLDRIDGDGKYDFVWFSVNYIRNEEKTVCSLKPCDCHGESPGPLSFRSSSAILKPSVVLHRAFSRCKVSGFLLWEVRMQKLLALPLPTRPRSWCS